MALLRQRSALRRQAPKKEREKDILTKGQSALQTEWSFKSQNPRRPLWGHSTPLYPALALGCPPLECFQGTCPSWLHWGGDWMALTAL